VKRKIISLVLISMMALTIYSAVSVTTTTKAAAQTPSSVVTYVPGAKYIWLGSMCSDHTVKSYAQDVFHYERSYAGTAVAMTKTPPGSFGSNSAEVGTSWVLNPGRYSWSDIASKQVVVTMTVTYVIKADSYFGTIATANWGVTGHVLGSDSVTAADQPNTKFMTKTATFKGSVGDFFQDVNGKLVGKVWAGASSAVVAPTPGAREFAFSQVTINALALKFPK